MKNKNLLKKVALIAILLVIVAAIVFVVINSSLGKKDKKTGNTSIEKSAQSENSTNSTTSDKNEKREVKITESEKGTKYSVTDEEITPDIVIGDNYYGTQLNDINLNFTQYKNKTIEIEGLFFENKPYTFVGRYSTTNVCADCPAGFSYFEYEWKGKDEVPIKANESWIKVVGKLKQGFDNGPYYYIDVYNIEVMKEKGLDTVSN